MLLLFFVCKFTRESEWHTKISKTVHVNKNTNYDDQLVKQKGVVYLPEYKYLERYFKGYFIWRFKKRKRKLI